MSLRREVTLSGMVVLFNIETWFSEVGVDEKIKRILNFSKNYKTKQSKLRLEKFGRFIVKVFPGLAINEF